MKKTGKILILIGAIIGIFIACYGLLSGLLASFITGAVGVGMVGFNVVGLLFMNGTFNEFLPEEVIQLIEEIYKASEADPMAMFIPGIVSGSITWLSSWIVLVVSILAFVFGLTAGIIALISRGKKAKKGLFIVNFVFAGLNILFFSNGTLTLVSEVLIVVGSILSLVAMKRESLPEEVPAQ